MYNSTILHIIPYLSTKYGGPPYVAIALNKQLKCLGFKSKILTLTSQLGYPPELPEEDVVFFQKDTDFYFFSLDFMINVIKYIKSADLIFIHGFYTFPTIWSTVISYIFKKKIILLPHGMLDKDSINSSSVKKNLFRKLYLFTVGLLQVKFSNIVVFNSHKEKRNSLFNLNSIVIHNGIDIDALQRIECKKSYFSSNKVKLFFLGRLHPIKGIELIIDAINILEQNVKNRIQLIVAGTGDDDFMLNLISKSPKDIVKYIGHIDSPQKFYYLKEADIYLQPSYTEGLSISMLEAMASKVAMITTNRVGLYEELKQNNAALVIDYNVIDLKNAIEDLVENNEKRERIAKNAYNLVKRKFDLKVIAENYQELIFRFLA